MSENDHRPEAYVTCPVCGEYVWNDTGFVEVHTKVWEYSQWVHLDCLDKLKKPSPS